MYISTHLFIYLFIYLFINLFNYLFVAQFLTVLSFVGIRFTRCVGLESLPELCACAVKVVKEVKRCFSDTNVNNNSFNVDKYSIDIGGRGNEREKDRSAYSSGKDRDSGKETNKFMQKLNSSDRKKEKEVEKDAVSSLNRILSFASQSLIGGLPLIEAR